MADLCLLIFVGLNCVCLLFCSTKIRSSRRKILHLHLVESWTGVVVSGWTAAKEGKDTLSRIVSCPPVPVYRDLYRYVRATLLESRLSTVPYTQADTSMAGGFLFVCMCLIFF